MGNPGPYKYSSSSTSAAILSARRSTGFNGTQQQMKKDYEKIANILNSQGSDSALTASISPRSTSTALAQGTKKISNGKQEFNIRRHYNNLTTEQQGTSTLPRLVNSTVANNIIKYSKNSSIRSVHGRKFSATPSIYFDNTLNIKMPNNNLVVHQQQGSSSNVQATKTKMK